MGVDVYVLDFLMRNRTKPPATLGDTLWLGRQGFHIRGPSEREIAHRVLARYDAGVSLSDFESHGPFAEGLFSYLGSTSIASLDFSPFEGADILHDLNLPVPECLHQKYDCIFDGGTLEHIFNVPVALSNIVAMLRPGGLFLSVNAANNQLGHGFYQLSPELMWRYFSSQQGMVVEAVQLMELHGDPKAYDAPDPAAVGRRLEIGRTAHPVYLIAAIRKQANSSAEGATPQQSDYKALWDRHDALES